MPPDAPNPPAVPPALREEIERAAAALFVGREHERRQLDAALEAVIGGQGRLCLIAGEPGIGKTRLAESLAANATARGARVIWGRCWEGEGAPAFWPWVQVLRACLRQGDGPALAIQLGPDASYLAQVVAEVREQLPDLPAAPPLDSEQARFRLYDACCTFLKSAAADTPLVLVLDDLHWADKSSLLLLQFVVREIGDARLLVLGTYRDVEVSHGHPLGDVLPRLRRERAVDRILLRGLPEAEVHAMLVALSGAEVSESFARTLSRETAGNPFFIKEILRHLLDEGIARREGDRWVGGVAADEIRLPESVREVIGRRLARLGEACMRLLTQAAVIGHEFGLDVLGRVSDLTEERLLELVEEAVSARVVEEAPAAIGRYRFAHTLVRETLYGGLRTLERIRLHRRVAEVLEGVYARDPEPHLAELAHHFLEGLPGGDAAKAVEYATRAGDRANAQLAYEEAAIHYGRALQALELQQPPEERRRCELLLKLGVARWDAGGVGNPAEPLHEAAALAERIGAPDLLARAALALAGPNIGGMVAASSAILLERALGALEDRDSALRAQLMGRLSVQRTFNGMPEGAPLARAAIEMARRVGDAHPLAYVLSTTTMAAGGPDDVAERLERADELIRLAEGASDERLAAEGHAWKAGFHLEAGDIAAADREAELQELRAETSRQAYHRWLATGNRGTRALLEGRFADGERLVAEASVLARDLQSVGGRFSLQSFSMILLEQQGRSGEILPDLLRFVADHPRSPIWRVAAAGHRVTLGQVEAARADLESVAANDLRHIPRDQMWLYSLARISDVVGFFADRPRAAVLYDLLLPYADRCAVTGGIIACRGSISRPLGVLATVLGRHDDAERHFEDALEMNARIRARIWVAHTQRDYARMLLARNRPGDRERAAALAAEALATASEVGMKPLEAKVRELLATAGLGEAVRAERAAKDGPTRALPAVFRREGDTWTIAYEGASLRLRDGKGLHYIAHLLRHPGREFHVADLLAVVSPEAGGDAEPARSAALGHAGEMLDPQAKAEYRRRVEELRAELEEATEWGDQGRASRLREEIELIGQELAGAYGLGGRSRKAADSAERVRKAVASRIRDTIGRVEKEHPALALHLANAIHLGTFCSYTPEKPTAWSF